MSSRVFAGRRLATLLVGVVGIGGTAIALADQVHNNVDGTIDPIAEVLALSSGSNGTTQIAVRATNGNGSSTVTSNPSCDVSSSRPMTISLSSSDPSVATVSPSTMTFTDCGVGQTLTVTPHGSTSSSRDAQISATVTNEPSSSFFYVDTATFIARVAADAVNQPPAVTISGVGPAGAYSEGAVPAAVCNVTDSEDGPSSFPATLSAISGPDASGGVGSQSASCTYTDAGGLLASAAVDYVITDATAPGVAVTLSPASPDGDNGWYRSNVGIDWTVSENDSTSTLQATGCDDLTISGDQQLTDYTCVATSGGGTTSLTRSVKRDASKPVLDCPVGPSGWQAVNVTLDCTASDATSGLDSPTDAGFTLATSVADGAQDATAATGSKTVKDKAGNQESIGPRTFAVDRKGPVVSCDRDSDTTTWFNANQTVHCTATDGAGSGLEDDGDASFDLSTSVAPGSEDASAGTGSRTVKDAVGNETTVAARTFKVDLKDPSVICTPDDLTAWYGENKSVACSASDTGSDLDDASDATFTLTTTDVAEGEERSGDTGTRVVTDAAGNSVTAGPYTFKIDRKAPSISCIPTGQASWHKLDQTVPCTSQDGGSGVAPAADGAFDLTAHLDAGEESDDVSTGTRTVSDGVGNTTTSDAYSFKIDKKAPSVDCPRDSDATTWYGENQDVACTATEGGSGFADAADASFTLSTNVAPGEETEGAPTTERDVADAVGNTRHAGPYTFNVDIKGPAISCTPSGLADWHATDQVVPCTAADGGSGVDPAGDESFDLTAHLDADQESGAVSTGTKAVADAVGNQTTSPAYAFKIDRKGPVAACTPGDQSTWYPTDQTVPCTATDGGSGVTPTTFALSTSVAAGTDDEHAMTTDRTVADAVGNPSNQVGPYEFKIDRKKPVVTCTPDDQTVWYGANKTVHCTATDGSGSGLAAAGDASFDLPATQVVAGDERSNATTGSRTIKDNVDNAADAVGPYTFKVDIKGPAVAMTCPAAITLGQTVTVPYTATDGGSGPGTQSGTTAYTATTVGTQTVSVPAGARQDNVGNPSIAGSCTTSVEYDWSGFFQPIDNGALNKAKAGSAIPVKFSLHGNQGLSIFASGSPSSAQVSCPSGVLVDTIEETSTATVSGLKYDAAADQYNYQWKTDSKWSGQCRRLTVTLIDGTSHAAMFQFTK